MASHTSAPWKVQGNTVGKVIDSNGQDNGFMLAIAHIDDFDIAEDADSNKRLIASAPQLLEALEVAADYIFSELQEKKSAYGDRLPHKIKAIQDDLDKAKAAIKAAKGE